MNNSREFLFYILLIMLGIGVGITTYKIYQNKNIPQERIRVMEQNHRQNDIKRPTEGEEPYESGAVPQTPTPDKERTEVVVVTPQETPEPTKTPEPTQAPATKEAQFTLKDNLAGMAITYQVAVPKDAIVQLTAEDRAKIQFKDSSLELAAVPEAYPTKVEVVTKLGHHPQLGDIWIVKKESTPSTLAFVYSNDIKLNSQCQFETPIDPPCGNVILKIMDPATNELSGLLKATCNVYSTQETLRKYCDQAIESLRVIKIANIR